jgi:chaperone BCS1
MTSNDPDVLDVALTRLGRIDKKVYFGNISRLASKNKYMRLIGRPALAHYTAFTMAEMKQHANDFAERIPANTFKPAQVQNFLQGCRSDPLKALREVDAWVLENSDKPKPVSDIGSSNTGSSDTGNSNTSASFVSQAIDMMRARRL